jgi:hypothetical protein
MACVIEDAIVALGEELRPVARIPLRVLVEHAAVTRVPVPIGAPDSSPAIAYRQLAEQLEIT